MPVVILYQTHNAQRLYPIDPFSTTEPVTKAYLHEWLCINLLIFINLFIYFIFFLPEQKKYLLLLLFMSCTVGDKKKFHIPFRSSAARKTVVFFTVVFIVAFRTVLTKRPTPFTKTVKNGKAFPSIHRYFLARNSSIAISAS